MQKIGEEQNIQTLFRELRLDDERVAPRFAVLLNSAQATTRRRFGFKYSFVVSTVLLVISLISLALWFRGRARNQQQNVEAAIPSPGPTISAPLRTLKSEPNEVAPLSANYRANARRRAMWLAERRRIRRHVLRDLAIRNAVAVSSWQSPTALLMQSPADDLLKSLPQMHRSVTELNTFLPDTQK